MWFYSDKPHKFNWPADTDPAENEDSAGFADPLGDAVRAFAWTFVVGLVAFLTWTYKNGGLPLWQ